MQPADMPCVICGEVPTVGYAYPGVEGETGRVCGRHAQTTDRAGVPVALDRGGVRNWGPSEGSMT